MSAMNQRMEPADAADIARLRAASLSPFLETDGRTVAVDSRTDRVHAMRLLITHPSALRNLAMLQPSPVARKGIRTLRRIESSERI